MRFIIVICILVSLLSACGTTYIKFGDGENNVNIYKNEKLIGNGSAKIIRNGAPKTITLTGRDDSGKELGRIEIRRKITVGTVLFAFLPYPTYISLLLNWKFDRHVVIPFDEEKKPKSGWDDEDKKGSAWDN